MCRVHSDTLHRSVFLQIFQAGAVGHRVVSNVEHLIGFMIRKMILQQLHVAVDGFDKSTLLSERMNKTNSTITGGRVSIGKLVLNSRRRHHGPLIVLDGVPVALPDPSLTFGDSF